MNFDAEVLMVVIGFMILANRLVDALVKPLADKFQLDGLWLKYIAWGASGVLVLLTQANLFQAYIPNPLIGQILTAVVAGGGSNLLHDVAEKAA